MGYFAGRVFEAPEGKKFVSTHVQKLRLRWGSRTTSEMTLVEEDATDTEVREARDAWYAGGRPDWQTGRILEDDAHQRGVLDLAIAVWIVVTLVMLGVALVWGDLTVWLLTMGFAGFTLLLMAYRFRSWLRARRFGTSEFVMDSCPAILGKRLAGHIEAGVPPHQQPKEGFSLELSCVRRYETTEGWGDERRIRQHRDVLWSQQAPTGVFGEAHELGVKIPVSFDLPDDLPESRPGDPSEDVRWQLAVDGRLSGIDFHAGFGLPVFSEQRVAQYLS